MKISRKQAKRILDFLAKKIGVYKIVSFNDDNGYSFLTVSPSRTGYHFYMGTKDEAIKVKSNRKVFSSRESDECLLELVEKLFAEAKEDDVSCLLEKIVLKKGTTLENVLIEMDLMEKN